MVVRFLIPLLTLALTVLSTDSARGQLTTRPFTIRDSNKGTIDVDHFIIKGGNKNYEFKGDTSSIDYKSLSRIDPNWIKGIEILREERLNGGTATVVIIKLKKGKIKKLPDDMKAKFE
jgi:hypothetical protein